MEVLQGVPRGGSTKRDQTTCVPRDWFSIRSPKGGPLWVLASGFHNWVSLNEATQGGSPSGVSK
jgi:hypothetical protein